MNSMASRNARRGAPSSASGRPSSDGEVGQAVVELGAVDQAAAVDVPAAEIADIAVAEPRLRRASELLLRAHAVVVAVPGVVGPAVPALVGSGGELVGVQRAAPIVVPVIVEAEAGLGRLGHLAGAAGGAGGEQQRERDASGF